MFMAIWKAPAPPTRVLPSHNSLHQTGIIVVAARMLDEIAGRRPLLLYSLAGIAVSEAVMGFGLANGLAALNIVGLFLFVGAFSLGLGPITWLFCSEIMPVEVPLLPWPELSTYMNPKTHTVGRCVPKAW